MSSVYQNSGPPARKGASPVVIGCSICGGIGLVCFIAVVGFGMFVFNKAKGMVSGAMQQQKQPALFLKAIKTHDYSRAESLMSPTGRQAVPEDKLKTLCEDTESKLGPLQSWSTAPNGTNSTSNATPGNNSFTMGYLYRLKYKKGTATAKFGFTTDNTLKMSGQIDDFGLTTGDSTSGNDDGSNTGDSGSGSTSSGQSGKSNGGATKKTDPGSDFNQ